MLEQIASNLLTKFLGDYIDGLDAENLSLKIGKGKVRLKNLKFKTSVLDQFELPVIVKEGYLGEILLQIPWTHLDKKPSTVTLKKIFLLVTPKLVFDTTGKEAEEREKNNKKRSLEIAETLGLDEMEDDKKKKDKDDKKKNWIF